MSEYSVVQVEYSDPVCIKSALEEMGYICEEHEVAQELKGYFRDRKQQAEIIVRKSNKGLSYDIGFRKVNGKYELVISDFDQRGKTGKNFMENLKQLYSKHKVVKQLKRLGKTVTSIKTTQDGRIKIKALG